MMLRVRRYIEEDSTALWAIFFNTVRHVNIQDYSQDQVNAWAPEAFDTEVWKTKMKALNPFVAELDGIIVGYTDLQGG